MSHSKIPERWQRIAWAIGAHDLATDMDDSDPEFTAWAEVAHGGTARLALAIAQVINDTAPVHNHGPAEGRGLNCPEPVVNGRLRGACITTSPEPDPWPTAPLIVATMFDGYRTLLMRTGTAYESTTRVAEKGESTLTDVVPVTAVPVAEMEALRASIKALGYGPESTRSAGSLLDTALRLLEATDALGVSND